MKPSVRDGGHWMYLAVDRTGQTVDFYLSESRDREAAKLFHNRGLLLATLQSYPAAVRELQEEGYLHRR